MIWRLFLKIIGSCGRNGLLEGQAGKWPGDYCNDPGKGWWSLKLGCAWWRAAGFCLYFEGMTDRVWFQLHVGLEKKGVREVLKVLRREWGWLPAWCREAGSALPWTLSLPAFNHPGMAGPLPVPLVDRSFSHSCGFKLTTSSLVMSSFALTLKPQNIVLQFKDSLVLVFLIWQESSLFQRN